MAKRSKLTLTSALDQNEAAAKGPNPTADEKNRTAPLDVPSSPAGLQKKSKPAFLGIALLALLAAGTVLLVKKRF